MVNFYLYYIFFIRILSNLCTLGAFLFAKFKSLEILKNGTFMYNKFNIKNFLSTYECWGFGSEESRVWLIYLNEITNILNHTISQSKLYAIYL